MKKFNYDFLAINKEYFGNGLKAIDLVILSQIEEFERNDRVCYMTDEQFMYITGEKKYTVRTSLDRLEDNNIIVRSTKPVTNNGKANKRRYISLIKNYQYAILKGNTCCVENQYIKDNLKNNVKDNKNIITEETSSSVERIRPIRYY